MTSIRTTLNIDDTALSIIKSYAESRAISLGEAASDLVQRGASSLPQFKKKNGWVIFESAAGGQVLTDEVVKGWEAADADEEYRDAFSPRR
ncbi:MAG: putative antitoxin VapB38 [Bryobacterales bacterium]|jgi:hypothetical protein|nr:putative antitoxin VapB38 [Bryobacterales bacterium]